MIGQLKAWRCLRQANLDPSFQTSILDIIEPHYLSNGVRMESIRLDVGVALLISTILLTTNSYNRYLAVAARVVRRSLKEQARLQAERRGEMDLRFAKWQVSDMNTVISGLEPVQSVTDGVPKCRTENREIIRTWRLPTQVRWRRSPHNRIKRPWWGYCG